jgi:hypothetical protein
MDALEVLYRVPARLSFTPSLDTFPITTTGCATNCGAGSEAIWNLGTLAAGAVQNITIKTTVATGLERGSLIRAAVRVTASGMKDTINLQHTAVVE